MVKQSAMDGRWDAIERRLYEIRVEFRNQRNELRQWAERLECRRRRRLRSREENGETVEPATVQEPITMREPEEVEKKMEKILVTQKLKNSDVARSVKSLEDEVRFFTDPLYDTDDEDTQSRIDWGLTEGSSPELLPPPNCETTVDEVQFSCESLFLSHGVDVMNPLAAKEDWTPGEGSVAEAPPHREVGKQSLSLVTEGRDRKGVEEKMGKNDEAKEGSREDSDRKPPPEPPDEGADKAELQPACEGGATIFSLLFGLRNGYVREREIWVDWISRELGFWTETMGQAQYLLITPPQFTNTMRLLQEKNEVQKIVGLFLQTICVIFPTEHRIRIFNIPMQSCWVTSLFDDHSSPTLAIKRLEELSLETFLLVVEDEKLRHNCNGCQPHFKEVVTLIKLLVGEGRRRGSRFIQFINVSILVPPLVLKWDPGGIQQRRKGMIGVQLCETRNFACNMSTKLLNSALFLIINTIAKGRYDTSNYPSKLLALTGEILLAGGAIFRPQLHFLIEEIITYWESIQDQGKVVKSQVWNHITSCVQMESGNSKEAIDLLCEWLMGFVSDSTGMMGNKLMEFSEKDEENSSGITVFEWHKLMAEHLIQRVESSRIETHQKQWDPGEPYSASCIIETSCFKLWDPGQLNCPITATAYGYHWHVFLNFLGSLNCVFDRGRVSVSCTASCFKLWDLGELHSASCIIGTSCFQLWDPGGRPSSLPLSRHLHLEDKVNFEGGSIDENLGVAELGQTNRFGRVYSRRGIRGNVPK